MGSDLDAARNGPRTLATRPRTPIRSSLAGSVALLGFVASLPVYWPLLTLVLASAAILLLSAAAPRRRTVAIPLLLLCAGTAWAAFGTTTGYFWLNRHRLDALVAEIDALPAITSLQLGHDEKAPSGTGQARRYDSYRFINEHLVTQYREQVTSEAPQPTLREIDVLRELGVPYVRYLALRASLERLSLSGFDRGQDGGIALNERGAGGAPWVTSLLYRADGGSPAGGRVQRSYPLSPRWSWILRG